MRYRIAKQSDASCIAKIQQKIKEVNNLGIFCKMGHMFLKTYYRILINDPETVFICAENEENEIIGFSFCVLKADKQTSNLHKHRFRLAISAIPSILQNPSLLRELYKRYKSVENQDDSYIHVSGAHGGYLGWNPEFPDALGSIYVNELCFKIMHLLGVDKIHFEVDTANKKVYKMNILNGAEIERIFTLPDGRERAFMFVDLNKHKFKL